MLSALEMLGRQPERLPLERPPVDLEAWWRLSDTPIAMGRSLPALRIALEVARYEADRGRFPVVAVPPGTGKTRIGLELAAREAARGRVVIMAEPTIALTVEKEAELRALAAEGRVSAVPTVVGLGALSHCAIYASAEAADPGEAERIARAYYEGGREKLCGAQSPRQRCPHAGACPGYPEPRPQPGCVMFCTHALLDRLDLPPVGWRCTREGDEAHPDDITCPDCERAEPPLVIIDESPRRLRRWRADRAVLQSLVRAEAERVRQWRREHPRAISLVKRLCRALDALHATHLEPDAIYSIYLPIEALADAIRADTELPDLFRELFDPPLDNPFGGGGSFGSGPFGGGPFGPITFGGPASGSSLPTGSTDDDDAYGPPGPPAPSPKALRSGQSRFYADPGAWTVLRALRASLRAQEAWETPAWDVSLRCDPGASWALELRRVVPLPENAACILLDATGDRLLDEWRGVALGKTVTVLGLSLVGAEARATLHLSTRAFRTPELFIRDQPTAFSSVTLHPGVAPRVLYAMKRALEALVEHREPGFSGGLIGLITHKPLANILRATPTDPAALEDIPCRETRQLLTGMLQLLMRGWRVKIGHYGADDRATNRFADVDLLLLLGDPRPDWGSCEADARALRMEPGNLFSNRTMARAIQAAHRARHLCRHEDPPVIVYVGRDAPVLEDVEWTVEEMRTLTTGAAHDAGNRPRRGPERGSSART